MQKVENLLVINTKVITFSKVLFFSQVLWVPDRGNMGCAVCCHCIASVSTDTALAALRNFCVHVTIRHVALGPLSSGWRLKKLPGASQGFFSFFFFLS